MEKQIDYKHEFKAFVRHCVREHYGATASGIAGMSFYDKEFESYPMTFGERRAIADQHGNIFRAFLKGDSLQTFEEMSGGVDMLEEYNRFKKGA